MLVVECPKRYADDSSQASANYDYYAGYSMLFAQTLLKHIPVDGETLVVDPWNGSGTTTAAAANLGIKSFGGDLNPVMVIVAKARQLRQATLPSVEPVWKQLHMEAINMHSHSKTANDPLRDWFGASTTSKIRALESAIRKKLITDEFHGFSNPTGLAQVSDLAAFFYVSLFRVVKGLLTDFRTTNPTWIRRAKDESEKISISEQRLADLFQNEIKLQQALLCEHRSTRDFQEIEPRIEMANSEYLPIATGSADIVLTSPPYCTRIDYAVATAAELAVLGFEKQSSYAELRNNLMGTTTVPRIAATISSEWGSTCLQFLKNMEHHTSIASKTYYLKNHLSYFSSLYRSMSEISRILKHSGIASLVVQDSKYKEIHNDLPKIVSEMGEAHGLTLFQRDDYLLGTSLSNINKKSRAYNSERFQPTESVVSFFKP